MKRACRKCRRRGFSATGMKIVGVDCGLEETERNWGQACANKNKKVKGLQWGLGEIEEVEDVGKKKGGG